MRDKSRAFALMLPKESQAIAEMKDLFYVVSSNFKKEILQLSELSIAEVADHLYQNVSEPMS
jgi:hypothetical protein